MSAEAPKELAVIIMGSGGDKKHVDLITAKIFALTNPRLRDTLAVYHSLSTGTVLDADEEIIKQSESGKIV